MMKPLNGYLSYDRTKDWHLLCAQILSGNAAVSNEKDNGQDCMDTIAR